MSGKETYRPAFEGSQTYISYGLPFQEACAKHVRKTFNASRVYIIASKSLATNTDAAESLVQALGSKVVGKRIGMTPHTLWSEILEVAKDARTVDADLIITLGAGSLTDASKIIALVPNLSTSSFRLSARTYTYHRPSPTTPKRSTISTNSTPPRTRPKSDQT